MPVAKKAVAKKPGMAVAKPDLRTRALATISDQDLMADAEQDQIQFSRDELSIPFLRILQKGSPQVNKRDPLYVKGAEPGMFYNTLTKELWSGEDGIVVVMASFMTNYTEWWPRDSKMGNGFIADHGTDASCLRDTVRNDKNQDITARGTQITKSALYHVVIVDPETGDAQQVAFPLAGTQLKKSKQWNSLVGGMLANRPDGSGKFKPAPFYMAWLLTTVFESNDHGDWFGVAIAQHSPTLDIPNGAQVYSEAKSFKHLISSGNVVTRMDTIAEAEVTEDLDDQEFR